MICYSLCCRLGGADPSKKYANIDIQMNFEVGVRNTWTRAHIHTHSTLAPKNKVFTTMQVIGAAPCPVRIPHSHWAAVVFLCASPTSWCQRAHLPPVPEDMPGMQTKAATGADSMGIMIDDTSLDRWEPLPLSSGEAGWLKKGSELGVRTVSGWTPGVKTKTGRYNQFNSCNIFETDPKSQEWKEEKGGDGF